MLPNLTLLDGIRSANNFVPLLTGRYSEWMTSLEQADTTSSPPGYLVQAEAWYAGGSTRLDGRMVALRKAHHLYREVEVPASRHLKEIFYRPPWLYAGMLASLLS